MKSNLFRLALYFARRDLIRQLAEMRRAQRTVH